MEQKILPTETLSLGVEWVKTCEAIRQRYFPGSKFDLANFFYDFCKEEAVNSVIRNVFAQRQNNFECLKTIIENQQKKKT